MAERQDTTRLKGNGTGGNEDDETKQGDQGAEMRLFSYRTTFGGVEGGCLHFL